MGDPLSIIASVAGLVTLGTQIIQIAVTAIDNTESAPHNIRSLPQELDTLCLALGSLKTVFAQDDVLRNPNFPVDSLSAVLNGIMDDFISIKKEIQRHAIKPGLGPLKQIWRQFRWQFQDEDITKYRENIAAYKATIIMTISAAHFATTCSNTSSNLNDFDELRRGFMELQANMSYCTHIKQGLQSSGNNSSHLRIDTRVTGEGQSRASNCSSHSQSATSLSNRLSLSSSIGRASASVTRRLSLSSAAGQASGSVMLRFERPSTINPADPGLGVPMASNISFRSVQTESSATSSVPSYKAASILELYFDSIRSMSSATIDGLDQTLCCASPGAVEQVVGIDALDMSSRSGDEHGIIHRLKENDLLGSDDATKKSTHSTVRVDIIPYQFDEMENGVQLLEQPRTEFLGCPSYLSVLFSDRLMRHPGLVSTINTLLKNCSRDDSADLIKQVMELDRISHRPSTEKDFFTWLREAYWPQNTDKVDKLQVHIAEIDVLHNRNRAEILRGLVGIGMQGKDITQQLNDLYQEYRIKRFKDIAQLIEKIDVGRQRGFMRSWLSSYLR